MVQPIIMTASAVAAGFTSSAAAPTGVTGATETAAAIAAGPKAQERIARKAEQNSGTTKNVGKAILYGPNKQVNATVPVAPSPTVEEDSEAEQKHPELDEVA